jgi:hypothetical protein
MSVELPAAADEWEFEARVYALIEANRAVDLREEIDAIAGIEDANWTTTGREPASFSKNELALVLLALGGPREVDG